jgi:16S rRNA (guanine527-N7)-methyltransferase
MNPEQQLQHGLSSLGLDLSTDLQGRLLRYLGLLSKWNRTYNLTAIREPSRLVSHHLLDSLSVLPHVNGDSLADVGTGAGLPGIPIALAKPGWRVVLLDSNHKKGAFLRQVALELDLRNVQVVTDRAEAWRPVDAMDIVISRAFSDLAGFIEAGKHLCRANGVLAAMKGVYPDEELAQVPGDTTLERVVPLKVPGLKAARHLVLLRPSAAGSSA